jgi:nitrogen fixation/metabolism regulation signal transduction histidine kinase
MFQKMLAPPEALSNEISHQYNIMVVIVFSSSVVLFLLIWVLILRFTQKITYPIKQLTHLTEMIKQATGRDSRE